MRFTREGGRTRERGRGTGGLGREGGGREGGERGYLRLLVPSVSQHSKDGDRPPPEQSPGAV